MEEAGNKGTILKFLLKGLFLNSGLVNAIYSFTFFGSVFPFASEKLFAFGNDSEEYNALYDSCYILFSLTYFIGGIAGGSVIKARKRLPILVGLNVCMILNSLFYLVPTTFTFLIGRFIAGLLAGLLLSTTFLIVSELSFPAVSGLFFTNSTICLIFGVFLSSLVSFTVEYDGGWYFAVSMVSVLSLFHIGSLLAFGRKDTPIFMLQIENSTEKCRNSLSYYLKDEAMEEIIFKKMVEEAETRKTEPNLIEIIRDPKKLRRNIKALVLFCFFEICGVGAISSNWAEVGTMVLSSITDNVTDFYIKILVVCLVSLRLICVALSGLILNFVKRKPFICLSLLVFSASSFYVFSGLVFGSKDFFVPAIICLCTMGVLANCSIIVGGEMASRQVFSTCTGFTRIFIVVYAIIHALFGLTGFFFAFGAAGLVYIGLYLTIYKETFGKSLADIEKEEREPEYKKI